MTVFMLCFREWNTQCTCSSFFPSAFVSQASGCCPFITSPSLTHICSVFLMKRKVMVPPRLIRGTEMHSTDRLVIESGGKHQCRVLSAPTSPGASEEGMGERDAERGDKNEQNRRRRETYSVIETVMDFVRSTCQGQVETASVREEERDERMGKERRGQLELGSR
ncbi:uncharacterized [Lates japonicus]